MQWLWLLLFSLPVQASWIKAESLSIDCVKYFPGGRAPLVSNNGLPNKEPSVRLGLNAGFSLPATLYWSNRVEAYADKDRGVGDGQFRSVGWELEAGTRLIPQVDIFFFHHSQHVLDHSYDFGFPVEDGVGFRLKVIGK